jgi:hypothetical protein
MTLRKSERRAKEATVPLIDPNKNWAPLEERLQTETDPKRRRQLQEVMFHIQTEAKGEIDRALGRLSPKAEYKIRDNINPPVTLSGVDQIRKEFYETLAANANAAQLEWVMYRVAVDDGVVVTEGNMKIGIKGSTLVALGFDAEDSDQAYYLQEGQHMVVWPFDEEGRLLGEEVFYGYSTPWAEVAKRRLAPEDIGSFDGEVPDLDF